MNETFPKNSLEHPTEAEIRAGFEKNESALAEKAVGFFENLNAEKIKEKAASAVLALSLFMGASSAFASEQGADSIALPNMGEETTVQAFEKFGVKNKIADFDWKKVAGKIELSVGVNRENTNGDKGESVEFGAQYSSEFYRDMPLYEMSQAYNVGYLSIGNSQNSEEFLTNLHNQSQGFSEQQKMLLWQKFGSVLSGTYNYDMASSHTHMMVSDDIMHRALRDEYFNSSSDTESGICGNIANYSLEIGRALGIKELFLQTGLTKNGLHVWGGAVIGDGAEKQIVFLDYGTLITTETLNYERALMEPEKYHGRISVLNNLAGNEKQTLFPVDSRASKEIKDASGIERPADLLERNLKKGEIAREERGLYINFSPETKKLKLNTDTLAFAFTHLDGSRDSSTSLKNMNALKGSYSFKGDNFGAQSNVTLLNMEIKGLKSEKTSFSNEIVATLMSDFFTKGETPSLITKEGYGKMVVEIGATILGAVKLPLGAEGGVIADVLGGKMPQNESLEAMLEGAGGARIVYVNPSETGKIFVDGSLSRGGRTNNLSEQTASIRTVATSALIGGEVEVFEGTVISAEVGKKEFEWGKSIGVDIAAKSKKLKGSVSYEKSTSDYQRFVPDSEKIELGGGYQISPKWEVDVIGFKKTERYKDAQPEKSSNVEIKLKMLLW